MRHSSFHPLHILVSLGLLLLFACCEESDNVEGIFSSHNWVFTGFCYTPNWDSNKSQRLDVSLEGYNKIHQLTFQSDGSLFVVVEGCKYSGTWSADGVSHAFTIKDFHTSEGNHDKTSPYAQKFIDELKAATWYRGDLNYLQLFAPDKHYYLLFGPAE